jgi:hypothetical protein
LPAVVRRAAVIITGAESPLTTANSRLSIRTTAGAATKTNEARHGTCVVRMG